MNQFGKMLRFYEGLHENMKKEPVFIIDCTQKRALLHKEYFNAIGVNIATTPVYDTSRFPKIRYTRKGKVLGQNKYTPKLLGYELSIIENIYSL